MEMRRLMLAPLPVLAIGLLAGCATSGPARLAYYKVPCSTPGAVVAQPLLATAPSLPQASPAPNGSEESTCIVAVSNDVRSYRAYAGAPGHYGRPFGSLGIGVGFGAHGGHHRGHLGNHGGHGRHH
jgi:hypothetical protein